MKIAHITLSTALALLSYGSLASSAIDYGTLKNQSKGEDYCLTPVQDSAEVALLACDGSASQNWRIVASTASHYFIHNQELKNKCLRTFSQDGARIVEIGTCSGDGYTSMRLWTINYNTDGSIKLGNKYNNDLGRYETLNFDVNTNAIKMSAKNNEPRSRWDFSGEPSSLKKPLIGNKKVLLMATHFNGESPTEPERIRKAVFGDGDDSSSLQHYLKLASNEKLTIDGTFLSNINIGARPSSCNANTLIESARNAARDKGIEPNNYDYLFVDISRSSACKWEGHAATPGNWILSNSVGYKYWMWSHEFGHNMGLKHSTTLRKCPINNGVVEINNHCVSGGGEDATDTMGGGGGKLYPVSYQLFAGWLENNDVPLIRTPGTYKLMPLWQQGGPQGYRIQRSDGSVLVLEFRQPQPGFENWPKDSPFVNGVTVRIAKSTGNIITNTLVDATPGSALGMKDAPLMPGHSLYDSLSGKLITLISADSSSAVIQVDNK